MLLVILLQTRCATSAVLSGSIVTSRPPARFAQEACQRIVTYLIVDGARPFRDSKQTLLRALPFILFLSPLGEKKQEPEQSEAQ